MGKEQELSKILQEIRREKLQEGEVVLWQGKAEPFGLLQGKAGKSILTKWIVATALLVGIYIALGERRSFSILIIFGIILAYVWLSPIYEWKSLLKKRYWITNKRIFLTAWDGVIYASFDEIDGYRTVQEENQTGQSLVFGKCIFKDIDKLLRWRANRPMGTSSTEESKGIVFYNIKDAALVSSLLEEKLYAV